MGHSEAASGLCCIAKVLLAAQTGTIPGNLHFKTPNPSLVGITSGRMKVVDKNTSWSGGIVGVNSFGFGGSNVHVILETEVSPHDPIAVNIPQLVPYSARTMQGVEDVLSEAKNLQPDQMELLRLVHNTNIPSHRFRGFAIPELSIMERQELANPKVRPPVWLVFSGMGSQWKGMGRDMFQFSVFRDCFQKLYKALIPHNIDIISYIMDDNPDAPSEGFCSAICICAIQIALVDLIKALEIPIDGYFGHSFGEMACAYVDGYYTAEDIILLAWARSRGILDSNLVPGAMASLGLSWEETVAKCPKEITPACHNAPDNVSVAGTPEAIKKFIAQLKSENVFAREIDSAGYAFHSELMKPAENLCRKYFAELNMKPELRSPKWVSTSTPKHLVDTDAGMYVCDDYFVNNVLSPVLFNDALQKVPADAIVIEIAPHGILQAILKRSLPKTCTVISLCSRSSTNNIEFFLKNVGNMFNSGLQPQISNLYPASNFPLSSATPCLSPLIQWDHRQTWAVPDPAGDKEGSMTEINLTNKAHAFYAGHKIDGRVLYPATGYLYLAWKALALKTTSSMDRPVVFENVELKRATIMTSESSSKFSVNIHDSGHFEIVEGGASIVSGSIRFEELEVFDFEPVTPEKDSVILSSADAYKELRLRGYEYNGEFQAMSEVDSKGRWARVSWRDNWIPFLDNMLQLECFSKTHRGLYLPTRIEKVSIDPKRFQDIIANNKTSEAFEVLLVRDDALQLVHCEGVEIRGVNLTSTKKNVKDNPFMEGTVFAPFFDDANEISDVDHVLSFYLNIVTDNLSPNEKAAAIASAELDFDIKALAETISNNMDIDGIYIQNITNGTAEHCPEEKVEKEKFKIKSALNLSSETHLDLLFLDNLVLDSLPQAKFIIFNGESVPKSFLSDYKLIAAKNTSTLSYFLLKKNSETVVYEKVQIGKDFQWVAEIQNKLKEGKGVDLIATAPSDGIIGFVRTLRKEPNGENIRCYYEKEDVQNTETWPQLTYNVYEAGRWGAYYSYELSQSSFEKEGSADAYVNALTPGDLSSLVWLESPKSTEAGENVLVSHAALNFRDVMLATGMSIFLKSVTFNGILLDAMMQGKEDEKLVVSTLLQNGIDSGVVQPLRSTVYSNQELEPAFRYLASGSHIGKVVIEVNSSNNFPNLPNLKSLSRTYFNNQKSYIIIGGLGGFGLELASWMVDRGARKLVFVSRSGITNKYQEYRIQVWSERGTEVLVSQDDMTTLQGSKTVLEKANALGPLGGIFNLAMVLKDALFEHQTLANFEAVASPKINVTRHLDQLTRTGSNQLDYFVVFSSVASAKGNPGQTNYSYANSFMERICEQRRKEGLPGLAIQWGAIGDVGVVHDKMGGNDVIIGGTLPQRITSCLNVMDSFLQQSVPVISSLVLPSQLAGGKSGALSVAQKVGHILGIRDVSKVNAGSTLTEMGMDSLMSSEIKQVLEREKIILTAEEIGKLCFSFLTDLE
ncbi:unnamed protein product [Allacma fusca]|uniref:PKS/mFAS DH domain-containing protein n=1 Tax=Allacma fusca TaxID=39272 RepID=A0A8J2LRT9_9HEXA|nr:unnamed protein product [Allacma fusca]